MLILVLQWHGTGTENVHAIAYTVIYMLVVMSGDWKQRMGQEPSDFVTGMASIRGVIHKSQIFADSVSCKLPLTDQQVRFAVLIFILAVVFCQ